jgi:hypothetical protein
MFKSFKMKLEATEIVKILEKPCKAQEILEGRRYESRLRLFTESRNLDQLKHEFSWIEYKNQLKEIMTFFGFDGEDIAKFNQYIIHLMASRKSDDVSFMGVYPHFSF